MLDKETKQEVDEAVRQTVSAMDQERERIETVRANHRNRNRLYILLVALFLTFLIPYIISNMLKDPGLLKFSTAIAITPDALLTMWALHKHY